MVQLQSVSVSYSASAPPAVEGADFSIEAGSLVLLEGPSGSGKTSLLSVVGGLMRPNSGQVYIDNCNIYKLLHADLARWRLLGIGFVFQQARLLGSLSAVDNVALPSELAGVPRVKALSHARALMAELGIETLADKAPRSLSGGEAQRVAIARALVNRAPLILADEPTASLDHRSAQLVAHQLQALSRSHGVTIMIATHDPRLAPLADRVVRMADGKILSEQAM